MEDAQGAAPNIPFWLGEAPGRTDELSFAVARLRQEVADHLQRHGDEATVQWLAVDRGLGVAAAQQMAEYLERALGVLGALPTQELIVIERFFDESGGMQLVIHSPFGSRVNRAWGLALRKRFCRQFNFELQAAATEDSIILSLSTSHSFALDDVPRYLRSASAEQVLIQALLDAPLFGVRWRWNATTALALPRFTGGRKVAPQLQRMKSEDLLAAVFPDQVACLENVVGEREVPDHPLVAQTLHDCLEDAMDAPGWLALLRRIEAGEVDVLTRDLPAPSPLAAEALNARPYAFLDDAPLEERRTQAVQSRGYLEAGSADDLGRLDPEAIESVRLEAWPSPRNVDEMHEALNAFGVLTDDEVFAAEEWEDWLLALSRVGRATRVSVVDAQGGEIGWWVVAERLAQWQLVHAGGVATPPIDVPPEFQMADGSDRDSAIQDLLRSRLGGLGPVTAAELSDSLGLDVAEVEAALIGLQTQGVVLRGRFSPVSLLEEGEAPWEWCERHLLARIHRYTLKRLRREIEPVEPRDFMRFLFDWQHVSGESRVQGPESLSGVVSQLEGYEAPAASWEAEVLPARLADYSSRWLDDLCTSGRLLWTRLRPLAGEGASTGASLRSAPIMLLPRRAAASWTRLAPPPASDDQLHSRSAKVAAYLAAHGASFFDDLSSGTRLLQAELEDALSELVVRGRVNCDSYAGLRALLVPPSKRGGSPGRGRRRPSLFGIEDAGRWSLIRSGEPATPHDDGADGNALRSDGSATERAPAAMSSRQAAHDPDMVEHVARTLLKRYGVVCWQLMEREAPWLPSWRELARVYRRLEARGEIRGGRFVAGVSGEQFALPEAIALMRECRRREPSDEWVCLAAADPANLLGSVIPGDRVPRVAGARVLYRDGIPIATLVGSQIKILAPLSKPDDQRARKTLQLDPGWRPSEHHPRTVTSA